MAETRKLAAILVADVVGYSRLAAADEDRTLVRLRGLRSDLIDPAIAAHHGRIVKRTGDGSLIEFRSVVDAVRCAIEVQNGMVERNAGLPPERRIEFRVGIHLGDVVEEADGDLMGDGVNIAARLEGIAKPGAICLSEQAYWQVKGRLDLAVSDLGPIQLKNIAEPIRVYSIEVGKPAHVKPAPSSTTTVRPNSGTPRDQAVGLCVGPRSPRSPPFSFWPPAAAGPCSATTSRGQHRPRIFPSSYYPSPISPAIHRRTTLPTASPRTSQLIFLASRTASSSHPTPPSPSRARAWTQRRSVSNSAFAMCSQARCSATEVTCASTRSSSTPKQARIGGPTVSRRT
jgi:class 3 adenylate cyclase